MKSARNILLILTAFFILTQSIAVYYIIGADGEVDGTLILTLVILMLILLYSKKITGVKWVLTVFLVLYALIYLAIAIELEVTVAWCIALYQAFFGVYIHLSPTLKAAYTRQQAVETDEANPSEHVLTTHNSFILKGEEFKYPLLVKRYKALLIDLLLMLTVMILVMSATNDHEYHTPIMLVTGFLAVFIYEPILSAYSKTIGQRVMGIAVRRYDAPAERISLVNAYIRMIIKWLLGWLSFISIHFNPEHRAIHDLAGDSVMIDDQ